MPIDKRNLHQLQTAAINKRGETDNQLQMAREQLADGQPDTYIILDLERAYFLSRAPALAILEFAKAELELTDALQAAHNKALQDNGMITQ